MSKPSESAGIAAIYADKPIEYFGGARHDIVERLTTGADASILELGCGSGGTGRAAIAAGKVGRYVGIELDKGAAAIAAEAFEVLAGDVAMMDLRALHNSFDALIISEVLEHLTDPWATLATLGKCLKPGGMVYASSPNIAHWQMVLALFHGRFDYEDAGRMDRTHLRWFTPRSFKLLFESAGLEVLSLDATTPAGWKAQLFDRITGGRFHHLFVSQMTVTARLPAVR